MRWQQGRSTIDGLLSRGELEWVTPNREHADVLIQQAGLHIVAAKSIVEQDAVGAFQLLYDAARKSLCAVLETRDFAGQAAADTLRWQKRSARSWTRRSV